MTSDAEVSHKIRQIPNTKFTLPGGNEVYVKDGTFNVQKADGTVVTCTYKQSISPSRHTVCVA